ncbi:ADP-L-glycero-D-manno-heptose-6-epimerase [Candidatus Campbellbacteria bacterium RIFOXYC2_FULL_35_25]|uniref:ADP-L-glycero-D-manno-heptose-6-epimerase n=1 Tax=Candidatus Campbellbacteria bacterium RIFOXYC2_FULL_35_25 TaxID=1797582 RepID=A0A1F5EIL1_9BACT|nr:MAG: ADP-L-glycero-D-manno-heptose-6-epimerase [Candidatus Campbellbacteria bacterium RIFOXYC2_FULL_35_25]
MENDKQKLILVTGGAGFIGSHLCERLVREGHKVISLDNYFTGSKDNHVEGVEYREGHTKDIEKHITETPDIIYHLGEYSRVAASLNEPEIVWDLNIAGTFGVLEFWRKKKCKLVYAGSSTKSVGDRGDGVVGRDLAPYTWMKAINSELVMNYGRWFGLSCAITYFYNVYGPRERSDEYGTVIEIFKKNYLDKVSYKVRAPGTQTRTFTNVDDTVDGIILVGEKGEGDGFGISAKEEFSLTDVANMFGGEIEMLEATKTTRPHSVVDTTKIEDLGWEQKRNLKDYIEEVKKENK